VRLPDWAVLLRADNPSPMTLEGTNTYLLRGPDGLTAVDPGPDDPAHLARVAGHGPLTRIVLTHGHPDHAAGAARLAAATGAPVLRRADGSLPDTLPGLTVLATPGHTSDSVCLLASGPGGRDGSGRPDGSGGRDGSGGPVVLTGDTILGRGTTVVAHPDGRLGDYLDALARLAALGDLPVLPGHGPPLPSVRIAALAYLDHRRQRLEQVRAALAAGDRTPREVVARVYAEVDPSLWPAAELSVRAQLDYLADRR